MRFLFVSRGLAVGKSVASARLICSVKNCDMHEGRAPLRHLLFIALNRYGREIGQMHWPISQGVCADPGPAIGPKVAPAGSGATAAPHTTIVARSWGRCYLQAPNDIQRGG
jgi:hypothetical protein